MSGPVLVGMIFLCSQLFIGGGSAVAAGGTWTQADWSGGVGPDTQHQFASSSDVGYSGGPLSLSMKSDWYDGAWTFRKKLTVNSAGVTGPLTDFTVCVDLANLGSDFFDNAKADGSDIVISSSDGITKLPRHLVAFDGGVDTGALYFKAPALSNAAPTDFYVYFGNPAAAEVNSTATWDTSYKGVWCLEENPAGAPPQMLDSSAAGNGGTTAGAMTAVQSVSARIGKGLDLDGSNDDVTINNIGVTTVAGQKNTVEFWMYWRGGNGRMPMGWNTSYDLWLQSNAFGFNTGNSNVEGFSGTAFLVNSWHHVVAVFPNGVPDNTTAELWVDGQKRTITHQFGGAPGSRTATPRMLISGWGASAGYKIDAIMDEVRVSSIARSSDWIQTSYNNQSNPAAFYGVGSLEGSYCLSGNLTSNAFRPGDDVRWGTVSWVESAPAGTSVAVEISTDDGATFNPVSNGSTIGTVTDDVTYRVTLGSTNGTAAPTFTSISINYEYLTDAAASSVTAAPPSVPANGTSTSTVTVTAKAFNGVLQTGHTISFSSSRGAADVFSSPTAVTDVLGRASVTVRSSVPGSSTITAIDTYDSVEIAQKPTISFIPIADANVSTVTASPATLPADGTTSTVKAVIKAYTGVTIPGHLVHFTSNRGADYFSAYDVYTNAYGEAQTSVASSEAGESKITVLDMTDGVTLTTQPTIVFEEVEVDEPEPSSPSGDTDPDMSWVVLSADCCPADDSTETEVAAFLLDAEGNTIQGHAVVISSDRAADQITQPVDQTDEDGYAVGSIKSAEVGNSTITVKDQTSDITLDEKPVLEFTTPEATPPGDEESTAPEPEETEPDDYTTTPEDDTYYYDPTTDETYDWTDTTDTTDGTETDTGTGAPDFSNSSMGAGTARSVKLKWGSKVLPGEMLTVTIDVKNSGEGAGEGVRVVAAVPDNTRYVSKSMTGTGFDERGFSWKVGTVQPGSVVRVSYQLQVKDNAPSGTRITPTATILAQNAPPFSVGRDPKTKKPLVELQVATYEAAAKSPFVANPLLWIGIMAFLGVCGTSVYLYTRQRKMRPPFTGFPTIYR